jgi:RNA recognition motif-containing protein
MKTLFIRNLPFDASEADLRKAFEAFGPVHRCSIAKNRETGESRGFGFVDMEDEAANKAIAEMNGRMFANRTIVVQESDPKGRTAGPGGPSSGGPRPPGPRPPGAGMHNSGTGGSGSPADRRDPAVDTKIAPRRRRRIATLVRPHRRPRNATAFIKKRRIASNPTSAITSTSARS